MAKFEYEVSETRSVDVPGCPLCGSEDLKFWNCNRDDARSAAAYVRCKNCGHEVKADGYKLHLDWGVDCQLEAIREWKSQASMYGHKPVFTKEFIAEKDKFKSFATDCLGFLKAGCSWPFCSSCGKNARLRGD